MSKLLGTNATFELVGSLRSLLREFAARDQDLRQAQQRASAGLSQAAANARQACAAELAEALAVADAEHEAARQSVQSRFDRRQAQIHQASSSSRKRALERINHQEGRQKYRIQKRALDAERQRESALTDAAARLAQVRDQVAQSQDQFQALERSARHAFSGAAGLAQCLSPDRAWPEASGTSDEHQLLAQLGQIQHDVGEALQRFKKKWIAAIFRVFPLWAQIAVALIGFGAVLVILPRYGREWLTVEQAGMGLAGVIATIILLYWIGKQVARPAALAIASDLAKARQWLPLALQKAEQHHLEQQDQIKSRWENTDRALDAEWQKTLGEAEEQRALYPKRLDDKQARAVRKNAAWHQRALEELAAHHALATARLREEAQVREQELIAAGEPKRGELETAFAARVRTLHEEWQPRFQAVWDQIESARRSAEELFPAWNDPAWERWAPADAFAHVARFGELIVDAGQLAGVDLANMGLPSPVPARFAVPLLLAFPHEASLLLETADTGFEQARDAINSVLFRLLAQAPPGRLSLTLMDPVGLGQSFATLMHLADYEESPINGRIWTQTSQIEEKLAELNEHMEKMIQMYLRNEHATIAEYNAQAGAMAEKYHILVIAGFPSNFSETAGRRLLNIAASGARCGVHTLIQWDRRRELPHGFLADDLRKNSLCVSAQTGGWVLADRALPGTSLRLDVPPPSEFATDFLRRVGQSSHDSTRVELPFAEILPGEAERWTHDTAEELRVPIGRSGASKLQYLEIGKNTRQHALVAGKTGSGKSTLFHVLITNLALCYSPDQVELYLVDFKKGVEFKPYASRRLPHARVVAIESDREFGLSVLQRVDEELRRRGELYRNRGVQDLPGYRRAEPRGVLPRVLLIIDEFQEFFTEEDRISQSAAVLLDRIVRQGRAFGIHVLLGSQTLGGAYTLARATLGQMVVRIALQCNEADAYLIMDESNAAPRLLSRPGEGIYNDMAGALEANSPFQTAWLTDEQRDAHLVEIRQRADREGRGRRGPIVFEGNAPAELAENELLQDAIRTVPTTAPAVPRVWLGAPNSIKGPTEVIFQRQSGSHLLIVGQSIEAAFGMPVVALVTLAAQFPTQTGRFILIESTAPASPEREFLDRIVDALPHLVVRPKRPELPELFSRLAQEMQQAAADESAAEAPATFLLIASLQDLKQLRAEDEFSFSVSESTVVSPATVLSNLITDGPSLGFHVVAAVDTFNNVTRFLGRKALSEFQNRVLFQMSASDSASLIDSPDASKLGLHRALLYNEREGYLEKFRPYAVTGNSSIEDLARRLKSGRKF